MGAPLLLVRAAATNPKLVGRVLLAVFVVSASLALAVVAPLVAIPAIVLTAPAAAGAVPGDGGAGPEIVGEWAVPMAGEYTKGRGFGHNPVKGCGFCSVNHQGYDMAQGCGSTIYAAGPGTVITAGSYHGYGNTVRIDHGAGVITLYGHMLWGSLTVQEGHTVTARTPIGAEGNTGKSFGCHLHYEVRAGGTSLDPELFMAARGLTLK